MICEFQFFDVLTESTALFPQLDKTSEANAEGHVDLLSRLCCPVLLFHLLMQAVNHLLT